MLDILFGDLLDERIQYGRQNIWETASKIPQNVHFTKIVFLIIAVVFNVVIMIIISVNILSDCLISVSYVKTIQASTTTTTGTEHSARKLMPHATTVGPFTRLLWNTTTFNQHQDLFRSIGYSFCHISWNEALVCFICFPFVVHSIERRWISTQGTVYHWATWKCAL